MLARVLWLVVLAASAVAVFGGDASAQTSCAAADETSLSSCIDGYNSAASGTSHEIMLQGDIVLTQDLPFITNVAVPAAKLLVLGNGFTIDGNAAVEDVLHQSAGDVTYREVILTGANEAGLRVADGVARVDSSSVVGNRDGVIFFNSEGPSGAGLVYNSTITSNEDIGLLVNADVNVVSSTIYGNRVGVNNPPGELRGSLVARNNVDCFFLSDVDVVVGNVFGDDTCTGTATPELFRMFDQEVADNGCATLPCAVQTVALLPGSPAIDAYTDCESGLTDQRGVARTAGKCDAGAYEFLDHELVLRQELIGFIIDEWSFELVASGACMSVNGAVTSQAIITVPAGAFSLDTVFFQSGCAVSILETPLPGYRSNPTECQVGAKPAAAATDLVIDDATSCTFSTRQVFCNRQVVTIDLHVNGGVGMGTAGDDVILGTSGDDVIDAGEGSDVVCAGAGDDVVDGGEGDFRDFLYGGPGNDTIRGGFGIDYIYGEAGEDTIDGQGGSDRLFGGPDNDLMLGDSGADRMYGGDGDDEMRGMGGQDFMWGEAGNDLMQGNFQTDNMFGGPGDDTMFGAGGKDSLFGEAGNDSLSGGNNTDYLNGGDDVDSANGGRGRDKPLMEPQTRASNGQFFGGSGCIAETIVNCQPTP